MTRKAKVWLPACLALLCCIMVGAIQIGKSDGEVSQNDRNCPFFFFLPWSLPVRMICCSLPLALMWLGPILHSFQDGIIIGLGFSCIIWSLIIGELNFIGKIVHQWSKETASFSSFFILFLFFLVKPPFLAIRTWLTICVPSVQDTSWSVTLFEG